MIIGTIPGGGVEDVYMLIAELSSTDVAMRRDAGRVLQHDQVNQGGTQGK